jgi:glutamate synthase domain-containing protein 2
VTSSTIKRNPIDIDKVEPVEKIVKHFVTGAMSFGALSAEAHEALCTSHEQARFPFQYR